MPESRQHRKVTCSPCALQGLQNITCPWPFRHVRTALGRFGRALTRQDYILLPVSLAFDCSDLHGEVVADVMGCAER